MTTNEQLAEWIELGLANGEFRENHSIYLEDIYCENRLVVHGCALGAALVGKEGDALSAVSLFQEKLNREEKFCCISDFAGRLDISFDLASRIDQLHWKQRRPARVIAAMLRLNAV